MAITIMKRREKRLIEVQELHERALKYVKTRTCRRCGTEFTFDASDLKPDIGSYCEELFFTPKIVCPSCGCQHVFWFHLRNRWIGKYLKLRDELQWEPPPKPPREGGRIIDIE